MEDRGAVLCLKGIMFFTAILKIILVFSLELFITYSSCLNKIFITVQNSVPQSGVYCAMITLFPHIRKVG